MTLVDFDMVLDLSDGTQQAFTRLAEPPAGRPAIDFVNGGIIRITSPFGQTFPVEVNASPVNDEAVPTSVSNKGHTIPCGSWFPFMRLLQTQPAFNFATEPGKLWINTHYNTDAEAVAECIVSSGNFVALGQSLFIPGLGVFHEIASALPYMASMYDPDALNWWQTPQLIHKQTARNLDGVMQNVGANLHVYNPLLKKTEHLWLHSDYVETFPALPRNVEYQGTSYLITGYIVRGANVWGHAAEMDVPLRLYPSKDNLTEPCPDWHLYSQGVIPQERPDWTFP